MRKILKHNFFMNKQIIGGKPLKILTTIDAQIANLDRTH